MSKTYCGLDREAMNRVLDTLCRLEDDIVLTEEEDDAMEIAIQAVTDIIDLLAGHPVILGDDDHEQDSSE